MIVSPFTKEIIPTCLSFVSTGVYGDTRAWREGNRDIGVVIDGRIGTCYLCFIYIYVYNPSFISG